MQENIQSIKDELESKMINGLLDYVLNGTLPESNKKSFLVCYGLIMQHGHYNSKAELLFNYYNEIIERAANASYEKIKDLYGLELADSFIAHTERFNTFIYNMSRVFSYLEYYYLKAVELKHKKLVLFSLDIYKSCFYDKLKEKKNLMNY